MKKFNYFSPETLANALEFLNSEFGETVIVSGGTDIVLQLNRNEIQPDNVMNINKLKELKYIHNDGLLIKVGSRTTFTEIENNISIKETAKALWDASCRVGGPQTRNVGTIGGNIVNGSVAADSVTSLLCLDASLILESINGTRTVKLSDFYDKDKTIRSNEILTEIFFEKPKENIFTSFVKLGKRNALDIVVVSTAVYVEKNSNNTFENVRITLGAVDKHPMRVIEAENYLKNMEFSQNRINGALEVISDSVAKSIHGRPSMPYKRDSIVGVARQAFANAIGDSLK